MHTDLDIIHSFSERHGRPRARPCSPQTSMLSMLFAQRAQRATAQKSKLECK